ncbi:OLC1v1031150C1 [Oldenlandia corymbosa var. corymbosa]|uniref:OLC1v1031150C1 n=1 Tax=Oldenlandia corymbosa var. corymbosa TaxID=529605 RepID=A0AAV1CL68_OLDCO|nr:OLC1v1031150C1 [Oldenlandia corymbosa var. corymbosa]
MESLEFDSIPAGFHPRPHPHPHLHPDSHAHLQLGHQSDADPQHPRTYSKESYSCNGDIMNGKTHIGSAKNDVETNGMNDVENDVETDGMNNVENDVDTDGMDAVENGVETDVETDGMNRQ